MFPFRKPIFIQHAPKTFTHQKKCIFLHDGYAFGTAWHERGSKICALIFYQYLQRYLIRLETAEWLTSGGKNVHCSLQYCGMKVASGDTGFVNSAGTAGPIRTGDGSLDALERRNDDGGGHVAPRATWHVPRASACTLRKMLCQGCSPNRKWPGAQTFRSEAPRSELRVIGRISPEVSKLCPQGLILLFSAFCPPARTPLDLGTPNLVHGCTWARVIRICII